VPIEYREAPAIDYLDSPFGFLTSPPQPGYLFDLDVNYMATGIRLSSWEDIEPSQGRYDFSQTDKKFSFMARYGINTIIELRGINPVYGTQSGKTGRLSPSYPEEHLDQWARYIEKRVERYDGDGIDDAPGSLVIKKYQLIHELLPPNSFRKSFWRENPDKYAKFYKTTYDAIKNRCSDCTLYMVGGFLEDYLFKGDRDFRGRPALEDGFFVSILNELEQNDYGIETIGFDYHYWSFWNFRLEKFGPRSYKHHKQYIDSIKKLYRHFGYTDDDVSIISREAGVNGFMETERDQAVYIIKIYVSSIASGQDHLFWTSMVEYSHEADMFTHVGLVNKPSNKGYSHKKLGYYTYRLMVEKLKASDWENIDTVVNGTDNVYVYKFNRKTGKAPVYVAWWDYFDDSSQETDKTVTIQSEFDSKEVSVTSSVPDADNGSELTDTVNFTTRYAETDHGLITFRIGKTPVFIEPGIIPAPEFKVKKINTSILETLLN